MPSMEDDIANHLHMCVALMSDPLTMRDRPGIVADHFMAAIGKIERLQVLLTVPADQCDRHNWLGSSVLNSGVRQMVGLVLAKHMEPLRWKHPRLALRAMSSQEGQRNTAPRIFAQEFRQEGYKHCHETDIAREIKENNCMASLVLLYYYLHWHLLLILLNFRLHPCLDDREVEGRLNVDRLLKALPAFFDTFELRPLRSHLNRDYSRTETGDDLSDCSDDGDEVDTEAGVYDDIALPDEAPLLDEAQPPSNAAAVPKVPVDEKEKAKEKAVTEMSRILRVVTGIMKRATTSGAMGGHMLSMVDACIAQPAAGAEGAGIAIEHKRRSSKLINVYRMVLASVSAADKADALVQTAHAIGFQRLEVDVLPQYQTMVGKGKIKEANALHTGRRIVEQRELAITNGLELCSHSLSVFELQDSVQRWFDLCKPFEVKSLAAVQAVDDIDSTHKRYTCILSNILKREPFALLGAVDSKKRLISACIDDFNSAALMMDVCGSFLKIHKIVSDLQNGSLDDSDIKEGLIVFVMQTYASDRATLNSMKQRIQDVVPSSESHARSTGLVSTVVGNFRIPARVAQIADVNSEMNLFELAGHYWGSKPADFNNVNHAYFAWPYAERGSYKDVMALVQSNIHATPAEISFGQAYSLLLSPGHRNSLYISSLAKSMLAMIDALHCTSVLDGAAISVRETSTVHRTKKSMTELLPPATQEIIKRLNQYGAMPSPVKFSVSKQTLIDDLRAELAALASRVERARRGEFKLYTPMSWPVVFGADAVVHNNHTAFQLAGEMPAVPRTVMEHYMSKLVNSIARQPPRQ